jgi:hypothetical protein
VINDDGNLTVPLGIFQHAVHFVGVGYNIYIGEGLSLFFICFTSRGGIRSGVLAENQDLFSHDGPP